MEKIKTFVMVFSIISIILLAIWGVRVFTQSGLLKAEVKWAIDDKLPITQKVLTESIISLTKDKYILDTDKIKEAIQSRPWVAIAHIDSPWFSNDILIRIDSQQIAMRWQNTNCNTTTKCSGYISNNGELFTPKKIIKSTAPLAYFKDISAVAVTQFYQDYKTYQQQTEKMTIKSLSRSHNIDKLTFASNTVVMLGYRSKNKRLDRFVKAYKKLKTKIAKAKLQKSTFDMRYPKGFAVEYR